MILLELSQHGYFYLKVTLIIIYVTQHDYFYSKVTIFLRHITCSVSITRRILFTVIMNLMTQLTEISIWLLNAREWEAQALSSQTEILWWYVPSFVLLLFTKMIVFILSLSMKLSYLILCWSGIAKDEPKPVMHISFPNWLDSRFRFVWLNQFLSWQA